MPTMNTIVVRTESMLLILIQTILLNHPGVEVRVTYLPERDYYKLTAPRHAFQSKAVKEVVGGRRTA